MSKHKNQLLTIQDPVEQHKQLYLLAYEDQEKSHRRFRYFGITIGIIALIFPPVSLILTIPYLRNRFAKNRARYQLAEHMQNEAAETQQEKEAIPTKLKSLRRSTILLNVLETVQIGFFAILPLASGIFILDTLNKLIKARRKQDIIVKKTLKDNIYAQSISPDRPIEHRKKSRKKHKDNLDKVNSESNLPEEEKVIWEKIAGKPKKVFIAPKDLNSGYVLMDREQENRFTILYGYHTSISAKKAITKPIVPSPNITYAPHKNPDSCFLQVKRGFFTESQKKSVELISGLEKRYGLRQS